MPRHFRYRTPRPPKPPKAPKIKKPLLSDLKQIYKGLFTTDEGQRIACLNAAMQWYDNQALPYVVFTNKGTYTTQQAKALDRAVKCRRQGMGTTFNAEKETSYRTAIKQYELVCDTLSPVKIDTYYTDLDAQAAKLEAKQKKLEERYGTLSELLTKALKPVGMEGQDVAIQVGQVKNEFQMDPARSQLTLRRDVVRELRRRVRAEGLLPVVFTVLDPLSRMCAMRPQYDQSGVPTGGYVVAPSDQRTMERKLMANFLQWAATADAPKRLVRPVTDLSAVPTGATSGAQRKAPSAFGKKGPKIADAFLQGTIIANLFTALMDGNLRKYEDLRNVIHGNQSTLISKLRWIDGVGRRKLTATGGSSGWTVEFNTDDCYVKYGSTVYQQAVQASVTAPAQP